MPDRYDVFVSYAAADREWVQGYLLEAFAAVDVRYLHEQSFALGAPRIAEFERAVRDSERTLLVLSPAYFVDEFGQFADLLAQTYGLETATWPVIPLLLRPVRLPPRLSVLKGLDATNPAEWPGVLERLCQELHRPVPPPPPLPACPYVGMAPFSEADRGRFFGREEEERELRERLRLDPFVAVIGPSGSGKSSLVHAGLVPSLRERGLFGAGPWVTCSMRPGEAPLESLAAALQGRPHEPVGAVRRLLDAAGHGARLVLVVDQLEELFTVAERGAEQFQEALLNLAELPGCHVVVTIRADFYPQLMTTPLWPSVRANRVEVLPLDGDALRQAILRPAEDVGVFVETALVERLLTDAAGEPGALPLVQETMVLLWERLERRLLPLRAYEALVVPRSAYDGRGRTGLQVAMARRADAALAELGPTREPIARRVLLRLVQFVEGRDDVRRQQPVAALRSAGDAEELSSTLAHLTARRLLTLGGQEGSETTRVDLAHEALISGWPTFQAWIAERRTAEQTRRRLEDKAAEWVRLGQGAGGLLDEVELLEAERWLDGPDAAELGVDEALLALAQASREALDQTRQEREEARQRELDQARALAAAQARGARILRRGLAVVALVAVVAIAAAGLALWQQGRAAEQTRIASSVALANQARVLAGERLVAALLLGQEAYRSEPTVEARGGLLVALERNPRVTTVLHGSTDTVNSVAVSPDGRTVAAGSTEPRVLLWDRASGRLVGAPLTGPTEAIAGVAFSPDGRRVAAGSLDGRVTLWEVPGGGRHEAPGGHIGGVRTVAFSPDGATLISGGDDRTIVLWDARTLARRATLRRHAGTVRGLAFSPDGGLLASASDDHTIILWDTRTWTPRRRLRGHTDLVRGVAFSPDGRILASGGNDRSVRLWRVQTGRPLHGPLIGHRERVFGMAFAPDGRTVAAAGRDHVISLWDARTGRRLGAPLTGHGESVRGVAFARDGTLVSGSNDRTVIVWDLDRRRRLGERLGRHPGIVHAVAVSPDGHQVASAGEDQTVRLWDPRARRPAGPPLRGHTYRVTSVAFSPDGHTLASGAWEGTIKLWDPLAQQERRTLPGHDGHAVFAVAFSPDGRTLASAGADNLVRLWDVASGQPLGTPLAGHESRVLSLAFSPDGRWLASGSWDRTIWLWDLADPQRRGEPLTTPYSPVTTLAFVPDGRFLLAGDIDDLVTVWKLADGRRQRRPEAQFSGHADEVRSLAVSPDGRTLASGSADGTVILWAMSGETSGDAPIPQRLGDPLPAHAGGVRAVAFGPDGHTVASVGDDGDVLLWDVDERSWQARACRIANRNLSDREWRRLIRPERPYRRTCPDLPVGDEAFG